MNNPIIVWVYKIYDFKDIKPIKTSYKYYPSLWYSMPDNLVLVGTGLIALFMIIMMWIVYFPKSKKQTGF